MPGVPTLTARGAGGVDLRSQRYQFAGNNGAPSDSGARSSGYVCGEGIVSEGTYKQ